MIYLKIFNSDTEYQNFSEGNLFVSPNISYIKTNKGLRFTPIIPAAAGDVAYWDGSKVKTTPLSSWKTSLGTPVGVVVVPTGFAPDGKARIIGLKPANKNGNQTNSAELMKWSSINTDASLTNYTKVPLTDNTSSASTGSSNGYAYLPSDAIPTSINSIASFIDPNTNYSIIAENNSIPSPYIFDKPNPEYYKELDGNNALSDFNGLSNTQTLVGLGTGYTAANAAWKYKDGASNLQWYLPGIGELGFLAPRFNVINNTLLTLNEIDIFDVYSTIYNIKSSTEYSSKHVFDFSFHDFVISYRNKGAEAYVYPFAII